ncbi:50S ribosomal protein L9 [Candidatus Peregrinibacteria bacterium]|nr:50S ribosomal protein L9 [Candidatus Peregrinibacteria bacterium]MBI3816441.1 50S ribosomal protein L9 [Candidatus Peregrinibacteria bacterium]
MEILLLEDVAGIGKKNDLLVVGDGFALNCLLPQRKALVATPTVRKRYAEQIRKRAEEKEHDRQMQTQAAAMLAGKSLLFRRKATKTGKLYAGISPTNIVEELERAFGLKVSEDAVTLPEHIKQVGTFSVTIKIGDLTHSMPVKVEAEEAKK